MSQFIDAGRPLTVLTEEERMFFDSVKEFARAEVKPLVSKMDHEAHLDEGLLAKLFEMGLMGIDIPEQYGGAGGTFFMSVLAIQALAQVDPAVSVVVDVQNTLVANAIRRWGTEAQRQTFLTKMAADTVGAYALSESVSGSDAFALKCRAEDKGDHFLVNGQKLWITNAGEAGLFIVFCTINPDLGYKGITALLVERGTPGFTIGKKEDKLGIRASSTCELIFENCAVPKANLLGEVGKGYKTAIETLNEGRIGIGAQMVGLAEGALDHALGYTAERKQFGKPLNAFQGMQFALARLHADIETAKLAVYNAARLKDGGFPFLREAAVAKLVSSLAADHVAAEVVNLYGGNGFTKEYPVEKYFRDAKIGQIYEGTTHMQLATIAKAIMPE
jgi:alkylation response protein AidB-like acyl-CoA dehydrogenase